MGLETSNLLELRGDIFLAERTASGAVKQMFYVGEAPQCNLEQSQNVEKVKDTGVGGMNATLAKIEKDLELKLKITLRDIKKQVLKLLSRGSDISISSGSVSNETLAGGATNVAVGDYIRLENPNVSALVVTDSAGTPATLTLNTHYSIVDAKAGIIKILNVGAFTQPFKAAYTKGATTGVAALGGEGSEYFLMLRGENVTKKPYKRVVFEAFRLDANLAAQIALKSEEAAQFEVEAELLYDETRDDNSAYGPYYRVIYNDALDA